MLFPLGKKALLYIGPEKNLAFHLNFWYKSALAFYARQFNFGVIQMSRVCQVTGKRPLVGNKVSHANNKTKRRFLPNIQTHKYWVEEEKRYVYLKLTTRGMRTIDKIGIKAVLDKLRAKGEKV